MSCPLCDHSHPELTLQVIRKDGKYSVTAREGSFVGWAFDKDEEVAKSKALLRLRADKEGWFR